MPFKKGRTKTGGRKVGSTSPLKDLKKICEEQGFCFATKLVELAQSPDPTISMQAVREGMKYLYVQVSQVKLTNNENGPVDVKQSSLMDEVIADALKFIKTKGNETRGA